MAAICLGLNVLIYQLNIADFWLLTDLIRNLQYNPRLYGQQNTRLILDLHPANERRRYKVTPSLIGWAQT